MHNAIVHHLLSSLSLSSSLWPPFSSSSLYTEYHMVWDIPWLSWGQLPWLCPLPASCAAPASRWWDGLGDKKASTPVSAAQQQLNTSV